LKPSPQKNVYTNYFIVYHLAGPDLASG